MLIIITILLLCSCGKGVEETTEESINYEDTEKTRYLEVNERIDYNLEDIKETDIKIYHNGKKLQRIEKNSEGERLVDVDVIQLKDRTLVPLQYLREPLGFKMIFDGAGKRPSIEVVYKDTSIKFKVDTNEFTKIFNNNDKVPIIDIVYTETPSIEYNDKIYVPTRFLAENFDIEVEFDGKNIYLKDK